MMYNDLFILVYGFQITVFRMGEGSQDIDLAILTALLKGETHINALCKQCLLFASPLKGKDREFGTNRIDLGQKCLMWHC